ncbi:hypothetical protein QBC38DRAFT_143618 [Podospora fimiseda]|uniref:Uncharacterized protein n=1 Tax=Podospora fimiseda TaxID=252190 RepID=A0AAN7BZF8_9PEZI|nr:hypothetical protein QBC38DRAFT_143618 [Podospora fimiseda]
MAQLYMKLQQPTKGEECYSQALQLAENHAEAWCGLVCIQAVLGKEDEVKKIIAAASTKLSKVSRGGTLTLLGSVIKMFCHSVLDNWWDQPFWRMLSVAAAMDSSDIIIREIDTGMDFAKVHSHHYPHGMLLVCQGLVHFFRGGCGNDHYQTLLALKCWEDARIAARRITPSGRWELGFIYWKVFWLLGMYHFDQAAAEVNSNPQLVAGNNIDKLQSLVREHDQLVGGISPAKTYLAASCVLQGDTESAKGVLSSDMVRTSNTLSDGDYNNDFDGLCHLSAILTSTGDYKNAYVALMSKPSEADGLFRLNLKKVLTELFAFGQEDSSIPEESPAAQIIAFAEVICSPQTDNSNNILRLKAKADELKNREIERFSSSAETENQGSLVTELKDAIKQDTTDDLAHQEADISSAAARQALCGGEDAQSREKAFSDISDLLDKVLMHLVDTCKPSTCDGCCAERWDWKSDMFMCKYCHDTYLCETCVNQLKARADWAPTFTCRSTDDWVRFPKITAKRWVETFMGVVWIPKDTTTDDEGHFIDGDEMVHVSVWLTDVMKSWGIDRSDWDLDEDKGVYSSAPPTQQEENGDAVEDDAGLDFDTPPENENKPNEGNKLVIWVRALIKT